MQGEAKVKGSKVKLRDALFDCLKEKTLANVTIKEVCERAGLNRVTFYRNYKTLDDIVAEAESERLEDMRVIFASEAKSGTDKIREVITMLYEAKEIDVYEGVENLFKNFKTRAIQICKAYVWDDWTGLLSRSTPLEAELGLEMLIAGGLHVITNGRDKYACEDIIRSILDFRDDSIKKHASQIG